VRCLHVSRALMSPSEMPEEAMIMNTIYEVPHIKALVEAHRNETDWQAKPALRRILWEAIKEEQICRGERHAYGRYIPHSHRKFRTV